MYISIHEGDKEEPQPHFHYASGPPQPLVDGNYIKGIVFPGGLDGFVNKWLLELGYKHYTNLPNSSSTDQEIVYRSRPVSNRERNIDMNTESFIRQAMEAGGIKQTEIRCSRCGAVDHTMMAVGQPATMERKFSNISVSIEMECKCGHTFELSYQNNEFTPVNNPTYSVVDYEDDDGYCDDDCGPSLSHGAHCNCSEDTTPNRIPSNSTYEIVGYHKEQTPTLPRRTYDDW